MIYYIVFALYMAIGFFFVKPKDIRDISWHGVDYSEGFFMCGVPLWAWILLWVLWLPLKILELINR